LLNFATLRYQLKSLPDSVSGRLFSTDKTLSVGGLQYGINAHQRQVPSFGYALVHYFAIHHVQAQAQGWVAAASFLPA
jgi:hypothetical protein